MMYKTIVFRHMLFCCDVEYFRLCRLSEYLLKRCFPKEGPLLSKIIDELLSRHEEIHIEEFGDNYYYSQSKKYEVDKHPSAFRRLGFALFFTFSVR